MSNRKFKAVILKKDAPYELDQDLADDFKKMDVFLGLERETSDVVGIVDDCWYNRDIIARVEIMDDEVAKRIEKNRLHLCPSIVKEFGQDGKIEGLNLFLSEHPDDRVVGEVEEVEA